MLGATVQRFSRDLCSSEVRLTHFIFLVSRPPFCKIGSFLKTLICHDSKIGRADHVKQFLKIDLF